MAKTLRIVIPGLLGPVTRLAEHSGKSNKFPIDREPVAPALSQLLSRSTARPAVVPSFEASLFDLFGATPNNNRDLPIAAVTRLADGGELNGYWWLRADPVHLRTDLHQVILFDARILDIDQHEAQTLIAEFNRELGDDGWVLEAPTPHRWYLRLARNPAIDTHPLPDAIGKDINRLLPQGAGAKRWRALLTEIQMLFYNNVINQERETDRQPTINSVWFWGGGVLPMNLRTPADGIYANDELTRGLARGADVASNPLPTDAGDWLQAAEHEATSLVVFDALRYCFIDKDYNRWNELLKKFEQNWFEPCLQALKRKQLDVLIIQPVNGRIHTIKPSDLRRFWRRSKSLVSYLN